MKHIEKWQVDAFKILPLTFHCIAIEITNRCNAQCSICYQSAERITSDKIFYLPEEDAKRAIQDAGISSCIYKRFHLAGGEAFLDLDKCIRLFEYAKKNGFFEITATTNAFWAAKMLNARNIVKSLRKVGVTALEISTDYWHQQYVHSATIDNCVKACKEANIKVILRILSTKRHPIGETINTLSRDTLQNSDAIVCGNVFLTGRAKEAIPKNDIKCNYYNFPCYSIFNLSINPTGYITPCCAGLDQSKLHFGNIKNESLVDILERMNKSQIARILAFFGVSFFIPILSKAGITTRNDFSTNCELCSSIFSDISNINVINEYIKDMQRISVQEAISYLKRINNFS